MTTVDISAAVRARRTSGLAAIALAFATALAGCSSDSGNLLGNSSQPAPTAEVAPPQAVPPPQASQAKIAIAPVIGAPDAVSKQIQAQLSTAIAQKSISVVTQPADKADYTLRGYVVSAKEKTGVKVSYIWDVTDPTGKRVNRINGEEMIANAGGKDGWAAVTPQVVQAISEKTAGALATWLPTQKGASVAAAAGATPAPVQGAAATPAPTGPTTGSIGKDNGVAAIVPSVTGAPGDGGVALTGALQRELARSGVAMAQSPSGAYKVEGKVTVGAAKDGKQPITIDWHVKDPAGKKLGTVSQKNEIPQGSLDGAWGKTADAAAAAAAQGILKLLPQPKAVN